MVSALAYWVAALFLVAGLALLPKRSAKAGALTLTLHYAIGVITLHVPTLLTHPGVFQSWSGTAEQMALLAGGLVACAFCMPMSPHAAQRMIRSGQIIFGICLFI